MEQTVAEYFAGIGLVRMGLEPSGWKVIFSNDISKDKYEMYEDFFPDSKDHYVVEDIFKLEYTQIPSTVLASCSFPCIDLSLAGNMNGIGGKHSSAFWGFIKALKAQGEKSPPLILVENVPGWLYSNKGEDFRLTVKSLNELGYYCDVFTLDALRFTPQSRMRVFLVGVKADVALPGVECLVQRSKSLLPDSLRRNILTNTDLKWFCHEIPEPPPLNKSGLAKIIETLNDDDKRWWIQAEVDRHLAMMEETHLNRVKSLVNVDNYSYRTFYRRRRKGYQRSEVRPDDIAGCLRTAVGGSGKQFLIKAGRGKVHMRTMTPREYARLQGVPDTYPINVNGVKALTGFGDAVCVPAITWISENVLIPLLEKYRVIWFYGGQSET